ncbi:MAG: hypothetical protein IT381_12870 [Deltaproteobacteria bacterium]|nr:hypothetical protein [Deltaproteobacteria bacterium]
MTYAELLLPLVLVAGGPARGTTDEPHIVLANQVKANGDEIGASVTIRVELTMPPILDSATNTSLRTTSAGLKLGDATFGIGTLNGAVINPSALSGTGPNYALPPLEGNQRFIIQISAQVIATAAAIDFAVVGPQGAVLSTTSAAALTAKVPLISLEASISREAVLVGAAAEILVALAPPKIPYTYSRARLKTTISGLEIGEAWFGDQALAAEGDGYPLPDLKGGAATTVRIVAHVVDTNAAVEAMIVDSAGAPLSVSSAATVTSDRVKVNAGCNATHAGSPLVILVGLALWLRRCSGRRAAQC